MAHSGPPGGSSPAAQIHRPGKAFGKPLYSLDGSCSARNLMLVSGLPWYAAHTRPRCEKKLARYCERGGVINKLPLYRSVHRYRGKTVVFRKPLFPGYLFLRLSPEQRQSVYQSDFVASVLEIFDQELFVRQLDHILAATETDLEIRLAPELGEGTRVRIRSGPLRGMEGWVEARYGPTTVLLRLDFIGQAAAVRMEAQELEPG